MKNGLSFLLPLSFVLCLLLGLSLFGCSGPDTRDDHPRPDEEPTADEPQTEEESNTENSSNDPGQEGEAAADSLGSPEDSWYSRQDIDVIQQIEICDANWLNPGDPSERMDTPCAEAFLRYGYGMQDLSEKEYEDALAQELTLDPFGGSSIELRYSQEQFARMADLAGRCTDVDGELGVCDRAVEYLSLVEGRKLGLFEDMNMMEITPVLKKVLAGDKLSEADLYPYKEGVDSGPTWSPLTYWKLGHAVYARHGASMKDPDLQEFFYGELRDDWKKAGLPDLDENPGAKLALSEADSHNLQLLREASPVQLP